MINNTRRSLTKHAPAEGFPVISAAGSGQASPGSWRRSERASSGISSVSNFIKHDQRHKVEYELRVRASVRINSRLPWSAVMITTSSSARAAVTRLLMINDLSALNFAASLDVCPITSHCKIGHNQPVRTAKRRISSSATSARLSPGTWSKATPFGEGTACGFAGNGSLRPPLKGKP